MSCNIICRENDRGCVVHDCTWIEADGRPSETKSTRCPIQLLADLASTIEDAKKTAASDAARAERERVLGLFEAELDAERKTAEHFHELKALLIQSVDFWSRFIQRIREAS